MSRLTKTEGRAQAREDAAAEVLLDAAELSAGARVLVADDPQGAVADGLAVRGCEVTPWWRHAETSHPATAWPEGGPYDAATLRLSKDKHAFELAVHAVVSVLAPGAPLLVYGANDEGIKSAGKRLAPLLGEVTTLDTRKHCRVLRATRPAAPEGLKATLQDWSRTETLALPDGPLTQVVYPGIFAKGGLDDATAALLAVLPTPAPHAGVLDFACGAGVIAAALLRREPTLKLQLLDADAVAAAAARRNVPGALVRVGASWSALPAYQRYDLIVSNPPIHVGKERDYGVVRRLIEGAPARLTEEGAMFLVLQRQVPVEQDLWLRFDEVEKVSEDGRFTVWRAARPARRPKGERG